MEIFLDILLFVFIPACPMIIYILKAQKRNTDEEYSYVDNPGFFSKHFETSILELSVIAVACFFTLFLVFAVAEFIDSSFGTSLTFSTKDDMGVFVQKEGSNKVFLLWASITKPKVPIFDRSRVGYIVWPSGSKTECFGEESYFDEKGTALCVDPYTDETFRVYYSDLTIRK